VKLPFYLFFRLTVGIVLSQPRFSFVCFSQFADPHQRRERIREPLHSCGRWRKKIVHGLPKLNWSVVAWYRMVIKRGDYTKGFVKNSCSCE